MLSFSTLAQRDCGTCCLLKKAEMEWGTPRAWPLIFPQISSHFCTTPEHLLFKCQSVEEKSAENLRKNLCTKNLRKNGRKNLRTKNLRKNGCKKVHKNMRTENLLQKAGLDIPFFWKMGSQKKKKTRKKICAKTCAKPQPQYISNWSFLRSSARAPQSKPQWKPLQLKTFLRAACLQNETAPEKN